MTLSLFLIPTSEVSFNGEEIIYSYDELRNIPHKVTVDSYINFKERYNFKYDELKRLKRETRYQESNVFDYIKVLVFVDKSKNSLAKDKGYYKQKFDTMEVAELFINVLYIKKKL